MTLLIHNSSLKTHHSHLISQQMPYLQLIRPPNLIIVAITQFLIQYLVLVPAFQEVGITSALDLFHFSLLAFSTVLIAAGGYVINDIIDYEIDVINKPERLIINRLISMRAAYLYYGFLTILGFFISLYLAIYIDNLPLLSLYPMAVGLLFCYSKYFKQRVLIGNVVVAIFCAFVAGIIWFAERNTYAQLWESNPESATYLQFILGFYLLFAFIATMFREIVKDMEDVEGDRLYNCRTLPIVYGFKTAKIVAFLFGILLVIFLCFTAWRIFEYGHLYGLLFLIIAILVPVFVVLFLLNKATIASDFKRLSTLTKFIMLSGLLLLFLIA